MVTSGVDATGAAYTSTQVYTEKALARRDLS
jgi:hypothetical protein